MIEDAVYLEAKAAELHKQIPLIDGHNDLPWQYRIRTQRALSKLDIDVIQRDLDTDKPRLRKGGIGGQFWSVYVPTDIPSSQAVQATMQQIDLVHNMIERYPNASFGSFSK